MSTFDRHSAVSWEKLFEREDQNGLAKLRVEGDYASKAYYETEGLIHWLVRNDHYTIGQIQRLLDGPQQNSARTHVLVG
jgi:hypothetical protein